MKFALGRQSLAVMAAVLLLGACADKALSESEQEPLRTALSEAAANTLSAKYIQIEISETDTNKRVQSLDFIAPNTARLTQHATNTKAIFTGSDSYASRGDSEMHVKIEGNQNAELYLRVLKGLPEVEVSGGSTSRIEFSAPDYVVSAGSVKGTATIENNRVTQVDLRRTDKSDRPPLTYRIRTPAMLDPVVAPDTSKVSHTPYPAGACSPDDEIPLGTYGCISQF